MSLIQRLTHKKDGNMRSRLMILMTNGLLKCHFNSKGCCRATVWLLLDLADPLSDLIHYLLILKAEYNTVGSAVAVGFESCVAD